MKHGYFAAIGCACLLGLALISCDPVEAVEIGVGDQTQIQEYLQAGGTQGAFIDWQWNEDEDGNRNTRLTLYGLQNLAFRAQSQFYNGLNFSAAPDSTTFTGSAYSGFYRYAGNLHGACLYPVSGSGVWLSSDLINISVSFSGVSGEIRPYSYHNGTYHFTEIGWQLPTATRFETATVSDTSGVLGSYTYSNGSRTMYAGDTGIPVLGSQPITYYISSGYNNLIIGSGSTITLPPGTVGTDKPWDYYNNILLPYMEEEFPGFDEYYFFPDGYTPPEPPPQVPTEFPTLPGYDFDIQPNGTLPADVGNTAYDMPDVPVKVVPVPSFDLTKISPAEIIAPFANGFQGIWALISDTLVSFDLLPVVSLCFLVLIITAFLALGVK